MDVHYTGRAPGFDTSVNPSLDHARLAPLGAAETAPVREDPQSETARVTSASRIEKQGKTDNRDSVATSANQQVAAGNKRLSTLRAHLAIAGYRLSRTNSSEGATTYRATRWGMTRMFDNLVDVGSFAAPAGVTP